MPRPLLPRALSTPGRQAILSCMPAEPSRWKGETRCSTQGAAGEGGRSAASVTGCSVGARERTLMGVSVRSTIVSNDRIAPISCGEQSPEEEVSVSGAAPQSSRLEQRVCTAARPGGSPARMRARSPRSLALDCRLARHRSASAAAMLVADPGWLLVATEGAGGSATASGEAGAPGQQAAAAGQLPSNAAARLPGCRWRPWPSHRPPLGPLEGECCGDGGGERGRVLWRG